MKLRAEHKMLTQFLVCYHCDSIVTCTFYVGCIAEGDSIWSWSAHWDSSHCHHPRGYGVTVWRGYASEFINHSHSIPPHTCTQTRINCILNKLVANSSYENMAKSTFCMCLKKAFSIPYYCIYHFQTPTHLPTHSHTRT